WRMAFALHYVGGMSVAEIARMIKDAEPEVERHLEYAREYLRQRLLEAGFDAPPDDQVAMRVFGAAGDVEVPAAFRDAMLEKYKRLEETDNFKDFPQPLRGGFPGRAPHLLTPQARPEPAFALPVVEPPLPLHKFVVVAAGEKADGDLEASRLAPAAAVIAPLLRPA